MVTKTNVLTKTFLFNQPRPIVIQIFQKSIFLVINDQIKIAMKNFEVLNTEDLKNIKGGYQDKCINEDILV
ncbi:bacteriocin-like protein [Marinifilum flexuosum]|uniref:Bacteriocin-like protein n=3 Tax=Marinifilum TaxID=866673 RepID=A0A419X5S0_9BACT|nr:bacteriocin-like protein [Marinifilum flexuosum]RKE03072.1 bacteriocin-like protein [Marinifilum flexuosum]